MSFDFTGSTAGEQQDQRRSRLFVPALPLWKTIHHRMPDELDAQTRGASGVPFGFERNDAEQQIEIAFELQGATFA